MTLWLVANVALAQNLYVGGDWGGADLIIGANDSVEGTFTNVGAFVVPYGSKANVRKGVAFEVTAQTIIIDGTIDANGGGWGGGAGGPDDYDGGSPGAGGGGGDGGADPVPSNGLYWGGGGAGGGNGGEGGSGSHYYADLDNNGGGTTGSEIGGRTSPMEFGSGGGGGSSYYYGNAGNGGDGGGAVRLVADTIDLNGSILANGAKPWEAIGSYGSGGGGGAGGTIILDGRLIRGAGTLSARGADGGDANQNSLSAQGGGGGGGGGRIKLFYGFVDSTIVSLVSGGDVGLDGAPTLVWANPGEKGSKGTVTLEMAYPDADLDGADVGYDNCPEIANPDQSDIDNDGAGDVCDSCPDDPVADADGDGFCGDDICPGGDDALDADLDGQPDFCDCAMLDPLAQTDGPERCDGHDNNCDGVVDPRGLVVDGTPFYVDGDGDGFGANGDEFSVLACSAPPSFASISGDCDDNTIGVNPDVEEVCADDMDNNCDGIIDENCAELDIPDDQQLNTCACNANAPTSVGFVMLGLLAAAARRRRS